MANLGTLYVSIVPTTKGIAGNIYKEMSPEVSKAAQKAGKDAGQKLSSVMGTSLKGLGAAGKTLGRDLKAAMSPAVSAVRRFSDGFRDANAAASVFTGKLGKLGGVARKVTDTVAGIGKTLGRALSGAGSLAVNAFRRVGSAAGGVLRAAMGPLKSLGSAVGGIFRTAMTPVRALGSVISGAFRTAMGPVKALGSMVGGVFRTAMGPVKTLGSAISGVFRTATAPVVNLGKSLWRLSEPVRGFAKTVATGVGNAGRHVFDFARTAGSTIGGAFATAGRKTAEFGRSALGVLGGVAGRVGSAVSTTVGGIGRLVSGAMSGVTSALSGVSNVASGVLGSLQRFGHNAAEAIQPLTQKLGLTKDAFEAFGKKAAIVGGGLVGVVAGLAAKGGIKRALDIEDARAQLGGLGHDSATVETVMDNALKSVKGTAFGLGDAATVAANAVSAGIQPGKDLQRSLDTVANTAAAAKVPLGDMGDVFAGVMATGKAYTGDINSIALRGVPMWQKLAEQLGVTEDEAAKMARSGKISFEDFQAAAEAASGNVAKAMGETTRGKIMNLQAALGRLGEKVFNAVAPALTELVTRGTELADKLGEHLAPALEKTTEFISKHADIIGPLAIGVGIATIAISGIAIATWAWAAATAAVSAPVMGIILVIGLLVGGLILAYQKVGWFHDFVDWCWTSIKTVISGVVDWIVGTAVPWIQGALSNMGDFFRTVAEVATSAWGWIKNTVSGVAAWFTGTLAPWIQGALSNVGDFFRGVGDTATGVWGGVKDAAAAVAAWFTNTLVPWVKGALSNLGDAFRWLNTNVVQPVWTGIKTTIAVIAAIIMTIFDGIAWAVDNTIGRSFRFLRDNVVIPVWNAVKNAISSAWNWIRDVVFAALINFIRGPLTNAWNWLKDLVARVWNNIKVGISTIWDWIRNNVLQPAINFIRGPFTNGWNWLRDLVARVWNAIRDKVSSTWNWIRNSVLQPAINFVRGSLTNAWTWLRDLVARVWNAIRDKVSSTWNWIRNSVLQPAINFLRGAVTNGWTWVRDTVSNVWNGIRDKVSSTWNFVRDRILTPMIRFLKTTVVNAWTAAKDGIKNAWNAVKKIVDIPVDFVINTVINKGFIKNFNKVAKKFKIGTIDEISYKGLAGGGVVPGYQSRKVDDYAAPVRGGGIQPLRGGEGVLVPEATRALGHGWVHGVNSAANSGGISGARSFLSGLAKGGVVSPLKKDYPLSQGYNRIHKGIDLAAPSGTPIYATNDGRVSHAGAGARAPGVWGGNEIHVKGGGLERWFAHLSHIAVRVGQMVKQGDFLGRTGNTGISSGPHLHFGVFRGGWPNDINPFDYLKGAIKPTGGGETDGGNPEYDGMLAKIGFGKLMDKFPGGGFAKDLMVGAAKNAWGGFKEWAADKLSFLDNAIEGGKTGSRALLDNPIARAKVVTKWSGTVRKALEQAGLPTNNKYMQAWLAQIQTESGGDPNAIQGIKDVNSGGNEAAGLVQVIPGTFNAYRDKSLPNNRLDPLANLVAGMNWSKHKYGVEGMLNVIGKGHGYALGGILPENLGAQVFDGGGWLRKTTDPMLVHHRESRPDAVLTNRQFGDFHSIAESVRSNGRRDVLEPHFHFEGAPDDPDRIGRRSSEALAFELMRAGI